MLRITQIRLAPGQPVSKLRSKVAEALKIRDFRPTEWKIVKESVDARKKPDIRFIYTIDFSVPDEESLLRRAAGLKGVNLSKAPDTSYRAPDLTIPETIKISPEDRPVVAGFGPAGMFAALTLAEAGARPLVLERGRRVERRTEDVEHFWQTGELDPRSNVQFGEGGAGTFSDGKLTTGIKDPRIRRVNMELIEAGADESIAYKQMPHVGTDVLRLVVKNIREKIERLGGEIRFETQVTGIELDEDGALSGLTLMTGEAGSEKTEKIRCRYAVFAPGNSARDTFRMLYGAGVKFEPKPFSVGVRIEHPQVMINASQYGEVNDSEGRLSSAAYKLSYHCKNGRGVYTFCMCPGGYVVAAASQEGGVVTNGMSYFRRDGENANSALLVGVEPEDFGADENNPLAGLDFQDSLEEEAYRLGGGGYYAPCQKAGDFLGRPPVRSQSAEVKPTYRPGVRYADLAEILPDYVTEAMREALPQLGKKLKGFDMDEAVMTGLETRSSCPVRMPRGENFESVSLPGIFPAGEGAGYAGGIMSAGCDGIRAGEAVLGKIRAFYGVETSVNIKNKKNT